MSPDALKRAGLALVTLIVLWGAFAMFRGSQGDETESLLLPKLTAADVDHIRIDAPADSLVIAVTGTARWEVNGLPASTMAVHEVFRALADSGTQGELVARSAASHERMEVDSVRGRRVRFQKEDATLADLFFGAHAQGSDGIYVRLGGSDDVYLLKGNLSSLLSRDRDAWREKRIGGEPADSIGGVEVERRGTRYTLQRQDSAWTVDGAPADSTAVKSLLDAYADISASGFPTAAQADSIRFARPFRRIRLLSRRGSPLLTLVIDSTASGVWAREESGTIVYRLDAWAVDKIAPADTTLRRK